MYASTWRARGDWLPVSWPGRQAGSPVLGRRANNNRYLLSWSRDSAEQLCLQMDRAGLRDVRSEIMAGAKWQDHGRPWTPRVHTS